MYFFLQLVGYCVWPLCASLLEVSDNSLTPTLIKKNSLGQQQIKPPFCADTKKAQ